MHDEDLDAQQDSLDPDGGMSRRAFVGSMIGGGLVAGATAVEPATAADAPAGRAVLRVNGASYEMPGDPRVTLLDFLRERLNLTGTKKGCDHGQCGACTVLVSGRRINSCLALAVAHEDAEITTIEGLGRGEGLHAMQYAFLEHDGLQCGYCTPGQICSAVAMLREVAAGGVSAVTADVRRLEPPALTDEEIRERMSGNLCRCGAYPNIVAAVRAVHRARTAARGPLDTVHL